MIYNNLGISECTLSIGACNELWGNIKRNRKEILNGFVKGGIQLIEVGILSNRTYEENSIYYSSAREPIKDIIRNREVIYSLLIEDIDHYNLDYLDYHSENTVDLIRVALRKKNIHNIQEYCQNIMNKGYKICIIIMDVDQYEENEYRELLERCVSLQPYGIYISGQMAYNNRCILEKYIFILHEIMPSDMIMGLQLNPEQIQPEYIIEKMAVHMNSRKIFFDACMYGINNGYSIAKTEILVFLLDREKNYLPHLLRLIDDQFQDIEQIKGTPTYNYLGAAMNCSGQYINYYRKNKMLSLEEMYGVLEQVPTEERGRDVSDKTANEYIENYRKKELENKLGIYLIANEFSKSFKRFIGATAHAFADYGIDLIVVDISSSDEVSNYLEEWNEEHNISKVIYQRIADDCADIGDVMKCLLKECKYEYVWAVKSEFIPIISVVFKNIKKWYYKRPELLVLYANDTEMEAKEYTDSQVFFEENIAQMSIWGTIIFRTDFLKKVMEQERSEELGSFWYSLSCFRYWDKQTINTVRVVDSCFLFNFVDVASSFWNEPKKTLFHWSKEWYDAVRSLPQYLECDKESIHKIDLKHFKPFMPRALLIMRGDGTLNYSEVKKYKQYLEIVSDTPYKTIVTAAFLPKWFARFALKKPKHFITRTVVNGFHAMEKIGQKKKKEDESLNIISDEIKTAISENQNKFSPKELCLVIPTANRANVIKECLECMLDVYESYGVDVIILDSSSNDATRDVILNLRQKGHENVFHEWYKEKYDPLSLDGKAVYGYRLVADKYKYIWMIRDRILVRFDKIFFEVKDAIDKNADYIIVHGQSIEHPIKYKKEYNDCVELFREQFCEMTVLGVVIVKSEMITKLIDTVPIDAKKNYTLWQPVAFFEYIASHSFLAIVYIQNVFDYHPSAYAAGGGSFWLKFYLWQWAERFYTMMTELPPVYGEDRIEVMHENIKHFDLYNMWFLIAARGKGGITLKNIKKYKKCILKVSEVPLKIFYLLAMTPRFVARCVIKRPFLLNPIRKRWNANKTRCVDFDDYVLTFYE